MPIEIKELHIRISINPPLTTGQPAGERTPPDSVSGMAKDEAKDAIVAECVEQILHILQNKTER